MMSDDDKNKDYKETRRRADEFQPTFHSSNPRHGRRDLLKDVLPKNSTLAPISMSRTANFFAGNPGSSSPMGGGGGGGGTALYHMQRPYLPDIESPDRQQYPEDRLIANRYWRMFHKYDPIFGTAIDMYSEMVVSEYDIVVSDDSSEIKDTINYMCDTVNLFNTLKNIIKEYLVIGECIPSCFFSDELGIWTYVSIHNPDYIEVKDIPVVNNDPILYFIPDDNLITSLSDGTPESMELRRRLPSEFVSKVLTRQKIQLSPLNSTFIARKLHQYDNRGTSLASRMWRIFMVEDAVYNSTIATFRRHACFVAGTKVLTNVGIQNVEDMSVGDMVVSGDGRFKKVEAAWEESAEEITTIKVGGSETLECTPNHRFKVWARPRTCMCGCGKKLANNNSGTPRFFNMGHTLSNRRDSDTGRMNSNNSDWIIVSESLNIKILSSYDPIKILNAEDIRRGDYLMIPRKFDEYDIEINEKNKMMARLLGYYVAEGCKRQIKRKDDNKYGILWSFSKEEFDTWAEDLVQIGNSIGVNIRKNLTSPRQCGRDAVTRVYMDNMSDLWLAEWCINHGGLYSNNKYLSEEVIRWPLELKIELLKGMYRGDGHKSKDGEMVSYATTSKSLAYQVRIILSQLGIFGSISKSSKVDDNWSDIYMVVSTGINNRKMRELLYDEIIEYKGSRKSDTRVWMDADFMYVPVYDVVTRNEKRKVYNITVEGDHSYIANGLATLNSPLKVLKLGDPASGWIPAPGTETKLLEMLNRAELDPQCFVPETFVSRSDGSQVEIGELKIGDELINKNGDKCVVEILKEEETHDLIEIKIVGSPVIKCTPNHKWPIWGGPRTCSCGCGTRINRGNFVVDHGCNPKGYEYQDKVQDYPSRMNGVKIRFLEGFNPYQKLTANELRPGDYMMVPRKYEEKRPEDVTMNMARLLGYYAAEGHSIEIYTREDGSIRRGVEFSFSSGEDDALFVKDVSNILENVTGDFPEIYSGKSNNKQVRSRRNSTTDISIWLEKNAGKYARNKKLSEEVMRWPLDLKYEFIKGYFAGDGCSISNGDNKSRYVEVSSSSYDLINQVKLILAQLGTYASLSERRQSENTYAPGNIQYRLHIFGEWAIKLSSEIWGLDVCESVDSKQVNWWYDDEYVYVKIMSVKSVELDSPQKVINMTVSGDHSYVVSQFGTYNSWIIYHYGIQFEAWGTTDRAITISKEHDTIEKIKLLGLGLSKSFMSGEVSYASAKSGLQVFLRRLLSLRQFMESIWLYPKFFRPISEIHKWYKVTPSEVSHGYRIKRTADEMKQNNMIIMPEIRWKNKLDPKVDSETLNAYGQLEKFGIKLSKKTVSAAAGIDWREELNNSLTEFKEEEEAKDNTLGPALKKKFEEATGEGGSKPKPKPPGGAGSGALPPGAKGDASHPPGSSDKPTDKGPIDEKLDAPDTGMPGGVE